MSTPFTILDGKHRVVQLGIYADTAAQALDQFGPNYKGGPYVARPETEDERTQRERARWITDPAPRRFTGE